MPTFTSVNRRGLGAVARPGLHRVGDGGGDAPGAGAGRSTDDARSAWTPNARHEPGDAGVVRGKRRARARRLRIGRELQRRRRSPRRRQGVPQRARRHQVRPARLLQFASLLRGAGPAGRASRAQSMQPGRAFREAIDDYFSPKPPRPENVNIYRVQRWWSARALVAPRRAANQQQPVHELGPEPGTRRVTPNPSPSLVVYVTDGDPHRLRLQPARRSLRSRAASRSRSAPTATAASRDPTLNRAMEEANAHQERRHQDARRRRGQRRHRQPGEHRAADADRRPAHRHRRDDRPRSRASTTSTSRSSRDFEQLAASSSATS